VGVLRLRREEDPVPRPVGGAPVRHQRESLLLDLDEEFRLGAHRLHHLHFGGDAARG
jgi:hypothetical protein